MPAQLENVTCGDQYTDAATAMFQLPTYKVACIVANQGVKYQVWQVPEGMRVVSGSWREPEEFLTPGAGSFIKPYLVGGVRFRNSDALGVDAQVTARAA